MLGSSGRGLGWARMQAAPMVDAHKAERQRRQKTLVITHDHEIIPHMDRVVNLAKPPLTGPPAAPAAAADSAS